MGTITGKKLSFKRNQIKGFMHEIPKPIILITSCYIAFGKLLISILSTVEKTVQNPIRFFETDYERIKQNDAGMKKNRVMQSKEWHKMNNLKQIYTSN
ncbi:hypothetical protein [Chryseobacterium sp. WLY505]|uniref:hypothetical protein n=1 Tax=Chryseobacterium sp. WLY505 TaxID=3068892 RepID=UPI002796A86A|nr:hypothetical protein [Chryseobacterium sp. WLY505]MDQ1858244.1 hypothetical protein [Chryseobacterium sp. WLY505]